MIDNNIKEQLKGLFKEIAPTKIVHSEHKKVIDFLDELKDVIGNHLDLSVSNFDKPTLQIGNITFTGIPLGHEFSSFVLAILNINQKGKFPDNEIQNRIKALKGEIQLRTFVSLDCNNCPDVVQILNQMTIINPNIYHEVIDGKIKAEEADSLNIQSVPSILHNDLLISSGRQNILQIIEKLEDTFGSNYQKEKNICETEVAIVGGGPAGVSAAIYTARKGIKTTIIAESIGGQLNETKGIENLIGTSYIEGMNLSENLRKHLNDYNVKILENKRVEEVLDNKLILNDKDEVNFKKLLIATGAKWRRLNIPGEQEFIGKGVAFCPHCDGPIFKDKKVFVIGGGNSGLEAALDLSSMVKEVVVVEYQDKLKADSVLIEKVQSKNIKILMNKETVEIKGDSKVQSIVLKDRESSEIQEFNTDGIFVQIGLIPNSHFVKDLIKLNDYGEIIVDELNKSSHDNIFAAGDVTNTPFKQIVIAVGDGAKAGLSIYQELS